MKRCLLTLCAGWLLASQGNAASLPEPETIFYGKVLNRFGPAEYTMTEGTLRWIIQRNDGSLLTLETALEPLADGQYSYRLKVPHQALALDLQTLDSVIPLPTVTQSHSHLSISLDGHPTSILPPGSQVFDVEQARRATTCRLDLTLALAMPDSDADGMPDWWESLHGLDPQFNDANADPDGDGRSNRDEYNNNSNPAHDNNLPELATSEIVAFAGRISGVLLQTRDEDTPPDGLIYTLTTSPTEGRLQLADTPLAPGNRFSQADVNAGRLTFHDPNDALSDPGTFSVTVSDGTPDHEPATGTITINPYRPASGVLASLPPESTTVTQEMPLAGIAASEDLRLRGYLLAPLSGFILWDQSANRSSYTIDASTSQTAQFFIGGSGNETFTGTDGDDWISGAAGNDRLSGRDGRDRFIFLQPDNENDTITDFDPASGDMLDLSRLLQGSSSLLNDYLRLTRDGSDCVVGIDINGDGSGYTDLQIRLADSPLTSDDLHDLWINGNILTRGLALLPRITVEATVALASENDSLPGIITVIRSGLLDAPLAVYLQISGSATHGVDFPIIPSPILIPAHEASVSISIPPYADALSESLEIVNVQLLPNPAYEL